MVAKVVAFKRSVGKYVVINFVSSFSKRWSFLMSLSRCYVFHIQTFTLLFRKKDISSFSFMRSSLGLPHITKSKRTANYILKNQARRQQCQFWALGYSFASPWSLRVECSWRRNEILREFCKVKLRMKNWKWAEFIEPVTPLLASLQGKAKGLITLSKDIPPGQAVVWEPLKQLLLLHLRNFHIILCFVHAALGP